MLFKFSYSATKLTSSSFHCYFSSCSFTPPDSRGTFCLPMVSTSFPRRTYQIICSATRAAIFCYVITAEVLNLVSLEKIFFRVPVKQLYHFVVCDSSLLCQSPQYFIYFFSAHIRSLSYPLGNVNIYHLLFIGRNGCCFGVKVKWKCSNCGDEFDSQRPKKCRCGSEKIQPLDEVPLKLEGAPVVVELERKSKSKHKKWKRPWS